ncbi:MAG: hypothetical protein JW800_07805, partial [Candidatus Omnitrophica bacterium]|nr:hypothetical protein [Candidatus Omnitrophota bacterium]
LISSLFLYYLVKREKKILQIMGIGAVGLILFNATWRLYGMITNWPIEKLYINARTNLFCFFVKNIESGSLPTLLKTIWLTLTWSSPALLAAAFLSSAQALKEPDTRKGLVSKGAIAAYGLMVYIIYILFRGQTYGITKYHSTALGVFAILIAGTVINEFIDNRALIRKSILAVLFLTGLYLWLVGDPVYIINYVLKKDMILTGGENAVPIIAGAISSLTIILFSVAACFLWLKKICVKKPVYLALFITGIAFCLSLSTIQILAEYNTVYSYGTSGTKDAIKFVEDATDKDDIIFGPPEIIWGVETNLQSYKYSLQINRWTIKEIFEDTLRKNNIKCLVYGIGSNTINSYRNIFLADEVITMLKKRYNRTDIGSFTIWVQK